MKSLKTDETFYAPSGFTAKVSQFKFAQIYVCSPTTSSAAAAEDAVKAEASKVHRFNETPAELEEAPAPELTRLNTLNTLRVAVSDHTHH